MREDAATPCSADLNARTLERGAKGVPSEHEVTDFLLEMLKVRASLEFRPENFTPFQLECLHRCASIRRPRRPLSMNKDVALRAEGFRVS